MSKIEFEKTNNFWIDNGIVGLYKILESLSEKGIFNGEGTQIDFEVDLSSSSLVITLINPSKSSNDDAIHSDLLIVLNEARNTLSVEYVSVSDRKCRWYFDEISEEFHLFNKSSYKAHLRNVFFNAKPDYEGTLYLPNTIKEEMIDKMPKKKNMTTEIYQKFINFQKDNEDIFQKKIAAKERNEGFLNNPTKYTFGNFFEASYLQKGKKICAFSGIKCKEVIDINGMYSPVMTGGTGEMNFASFLGKKPQISAFYAFVALFSPLKLYYKLQNDLKNYFVFYDSSLIELNSFYNAIQPSFSQFKNAEYCNFKADDIIGTEYENETLFAFIVSVYKQVELKLAKDKRKKLYGKSIFTFTNDGNIFRDVKEYTSLAQLFELFDAFDETEDEKFGFKSFLNMIRFFSKSFQSKGKTQYDTSWRNRLCEDILNFRSIAKTIEWFLGEVKLKEEIPNSIIYLDKIFQVYNSKTQFDMDKEMVKKCKNIGTTIGIYSQKEEDKSVLFSLRNAKNRIEFLKTLSFIQFRVANSDKIEEQYKLKIYEDFFWGLPDNPQWEEYKALVSIFAMNSFLYRPEKQNP